MQQLFKLSSSGVRCYSLGRSRLAAPFIQQRFLATKPISQSLEQEDEPMRFRGSGADWHASETFIRKSRAPPYQSLSVVLSLTVFMVYFCYLREENDVDEYIGKNVTVFADPYGELARLKKQLQHETKKGLDTTATKEKLDHVTNIIKAKQGGKVGVLQESLDRIKEMKEKGSK